MTAVPSTPEAQPRPKRKGHTRSEQKRIPRRLKLTFAWRLSSIEQNRGIAQHNVDRAIKDGLGIDSITILTKEGRRFR